MKFAKPTPARLAASGPAHREQPSTAPASRLTSVDALRGLVMIIMALDHIREFFHSGAMSFQPDDLTRTTAVRFFTRWITRICATEQVSPSFSPAFRCGE